MKAAAAIVAKAAELYGVDADRVAGEARASRNVSEARHVAMYVTLAATPASLTEIGDFFGRDRSTVRTAIQRVAARLRAGDPSLRLTVIELGAHCGCADIGALLAAADVLEARKTGPRKQRRRDTMRMRDVKAREDQRFLRGGQKRVSTEGGRPFDAETRYGVEVSRRRLPVLDVRKILRQSFA